jgi:hypothetical protein
MDGVVRKMEGRDEEEKAFDVFDFRRKTKALGGAQYMNGTCGMDGRMDGPEEATS